MKTRIDREYDLGTEQGGMQRLQNEATGLTGYTKITRYDEAIGALTKLINRLKKLDEDDMMIDVWTKERAKLLQKARQ